MSARQGAPADVEGLPSVNLHNVHAGSATMQQLKGFDKDGDNKISADELIDMVDEIGKTEREKREMKVPGRWRSPAWQQAGPAAETRPRPTARRSSATATASTLA